MYCIGIFIRYVSCIGCFHSLFSLAGQVVALALLIRYVSCIACFPLAIALVVFLASPRLYFYDTLGFTEQELSRIEHFPALSGAPRFVALRGGSRCNVFLVVGMYRGSRWFDDTMCFFI